jgi:2-phosphosulfolactate phosphatase
VIVVDVLSFSTCVEMAAARGAEIVPGPWKDERAASQAREWNAVLAGPRGSAAYSLSPASFATIAPGTRVLLPSPNGAVISLRPTSARVLCGCLRNATAVARRAQSLGRVIAVVPAGERWEDGTLRPALEDWLGAGAILCGLGERLSPEARTARDAFAAAESTLHRSLDACSSGRELHERGFASDVALAAMLDASGAVPVLDRGVFRRIDLEPAVS